MSLCQLALLGVACNKQTKAIRLLEVLATVELSATNAPQGGHVPRDRHGEDHKEGPQDQTLPRHLAH